MLLLNQLWLVKGDTEYGMDMEWGRAAGFRLSTTSLLSKELCRR